MKCSEAEISHPIMDGRIPQTQALLFRGQKSSLSTSILILDIIKEFKYRLQQTWF